MHDDEPGSPPHASPRSSPTGSLYFGHLDGALTNRMYLGGPTVRAPYRLERFRSLVNLHLLLYDRLVALDNFFLVNPLLRELLVDEYDNPRPYHTFVRSGVLVPARTDAAPSFVRLDQHLRDANSYGHPQVERIRGYAELLDSISPSKSLVYSEPVRRNLMAYVAHTALTSESYISATRSSTLARTLLTAARSKRLGFLRMDMVVGAGIGGWRTHCRHVKPPKRRR